MTAVGVPTRSRSESACLEDALHVAHPYGVVGRLRFPRVTVVIAARNEERNLPIVLEALPPVDEVVLVDGHSTDATVAVAIEFRPDVRIVHQRGIGKGDALRAGFEAATGDIIVAVDADGSADPAEIPRFVEALLDGADVAKGSRALRGGGSVDFTRLRRLGNRTLTGLVNALFGTGYTDLCYGYFAFWARYVPVLDIDCEGFEVETQFNLRAATSRLRITEVPSFELERIHGASNLHAVRDGLRVLRTIARERFRREQRGAPEYVDLVAAEGTEAALEDARS